MELTPFGPTEALMGALVIAGIVMSVWLFIAPIIITVQLSGINRKLKTMLDRQTGPGQPPT